MVSSVPAQKKSPPILGDVLGALYFFGFSALMKIDAATVGALTAAHPYATGFVKFALLATFGECLKDRITLGHWIPPKLWIRFLVWGAIGLWVTAAFPLLDVGLAGLVSQHMWPSFPFPFWVSTWVNFFGGLAFFIMFLHFWVNCMLEYGFMAPWDVFKRPEAIRWAKVAIISMIVFWIPMQSITFWLPPAWRILFAAYLGILFGLIVSFASKSGEHAVATTVP